MEYEIGFQVFEEDEMQISDANDKLVCSIGIFSILIVLF